jgi:hypothetical protein
LLWLAAVLFGDGDHRRLDIPCFARDLAVIAFVDLSLASARLRSRPSSPCASPGTVPGPG